MKDMAFCFLNGLFDVQWCDIQHMQHLQHMWHFWHFLWSYASDPAHPLLPPIKYVSNTFLTAGSWSRMTAGGSQGRRSPRPWWSWWSSESAPRASPFPSWSCLQVGCINVDRGSLNLAREEITKIRTLLDFLDYVYGKSRPPAPAPLTHLILLLMKYVKILVNTFPQTPYTNSSSILGQ